MPYGWNGDNLILESWIADGDGQGMHPTYYQS